MTHPQSLSYIATWGLWILGFSKASICMHGLGFSRLFLGPWSPCPEAATDRPKTMRRWCPMGGRTPNTPVFARTAVEDGSLPGFPESAPWADGLAFYPALKSFGWQCWSAITPHSCLAVEPLTICIKGHPLLLYIVVAHSFPLRNEYYFRSICIHHTIGGCWVISILIVTVSCLVDKRAFLSSMC